MTKMKIIREIESHDASKVWEIDNSKFYGFIQWNGFLDETGWLSHILEEATNNELNELLNELKKH